MQVKKNDFEENLSGLSFLKIEVKNKPPLYLKHHYVDYVEMISLISNSNYVTKVDLLDRFIDLNIIVKDSGSEESASINDKNEAIIDDFFDELSNRPYLYGIDYPFDITHNSIILKNADVITPKGKLYLYLLVSSSLSFFKDFQHILTSEFEMICYYSLINFMPKNAITKSFGKNTEYKGLGNVGNKLKTLASDINVPINEHFFSKFSQSGNQERGLDIVSWIPFNDKIPNLVILLGQCACGKEWFGKLGETFRFERYFNFYQKKPIHALFTSYSLIDHQVGGFYQADEIGNTLIFERRRILEYLSDVTFFDDFDSKKLIDRCIEYEEDIV
jgi:hypothetical protein